MLQSENKGEYNFCDDNDFASRPEKFQPCN